MRGREHLLPIVLLALLLYSLVNMASVSLRLSGAEQAYAAAVRQRESLEERKRELERNLSREQSPEELEQLARERLGLVLPGEKVFYFQQRED